jgi:NAD(P)-dependent dehydrogenase (short-subunit alcohol dehydrogenase family)
VQLRLPGLGARCPHGRGQSIKRFVEPEDVAAMCLFLASPASSMITGQAIGVDGHTEAYHL